MTIVQLTLTKNDDMVQRALYFIRQSAMLGISADMIMTCAAEDTQCDYPVCMLYGAESWMTTERGGVVPLTPCIVPWQVGAWLIENGHTVSEHETMRDGLRTKWYQLAVHVRP